MSEKNNIKDIRKNKLGATDIVAINLLSPFKTPLDVYLEKVDDIDTVDETNENIVLGKCLEKGIAEAFCQIHSYKLSELIDEKSRQFIHPEYDFISCMIDYICLDESGNFNILEIKNVTGAVKEPHSHYAAQLKIQMYITGVERGILCYYDSYGLKHFDFELDNNTKKEVERMIEKAVEFWNEHIVNKVPPKPVTMEDLGKIETENIEMTIESGMINDGTLENDIVYWWKQYKEAKKYEGLYKKKAEDAEKRIVQAIANKLQNIPSSLIVNDGGKKLFKLKKN
ncbi:MAG: hypothetical protein KatS3mg035_2285 [Bacteroidia bacterium]|nr:MAG: hypothetical protein KatS3mg035_2285 [Bacteroidia bacterium]